MSHAKPSISKHWWHFTPSVLVLIAITWLSLIKQAPIPMGEVPMADKWGHMVAYLVWTLCLAGDCWRMQVPVKRLYSIVVILPLAYGGLMELIQPHFPPRQGEWSDWLADAIGMLIGLILFIVFHLRQRRKSANAPQA